MSEGKASGHHLGGFTGPVTYEDFIFNSKSLGVIQFEGPWRLKSWRMGLVRGLEFGGPKFYGLPLRALISGTITWIHVNEYSFPLWQLNQRLQLFGLQFVQSGVENLWHTPLCEIHVYVASRKIPLSDHK